MLEENSIAELKHRNRWRHLVLSASLIVMEILANVLRFVGLFVTVSGLWQLAGGVRWVVSGRVDERQRSANSARLGLPLLVVGIILLFGGTWLANWAQLQ